MNDLKSIIDKYLFKYPETLLEEIEIYYVNKLTEVLNEKILHKVSQDIINEILSSFKEKISKLKPCPLCGNNKPSFIYSSPFIFD